MILLTHPKVSFEVIEIPHQQKDGLEILRALPIIRSFVPPNNNCMTIMKLAGRANFSNIDLQLEDFDQVPEGKFDILLDGYDMKGVLCHCKETVFDVTVLHCSVDLFTRERNHGC